MTPADPDLRSPELRASRRELRAAGEEAEGLVSGLTPEQLAWRPGEDRWSVAECLDHLVRTGDVYLESLDEVIGRARREGRLAGGSYRPSLVGRWLVRVLEPPPGMKVPAPMRIQPRPGGGADVTGPAAPSGEGTRSGAEGALASYLSLRPRFEERLEAADGLDLGGIRMSSPFFRFLRFDLGSAFRIVAAHERRHLWQARRVTEAEGIPPG